MARKEKLTVDYFPHYSGKKSLYIIEQNFGNDGYAVVYKNFELLADSDFHFMDITDPATLAYNAARCNVSEARYLEIVELLVKLGSYDAELFNEFGIIFSQSFIDNIADAYRNRKTDFINSDELKNILRKKCKKTTENKITYVRNSKNETKSVQSDVRNTQIKEKKIKEKEIKKEKILPISFAESDKSREKENFSFSSFSDAEKEARMRQFRQDLENERKQKSNEKGKSPPAQNAG